jgi:hypothetical protein
MNWYQKSKIVKADCAGGSDVYSNNSAIQDIPNLVPTMLKKKKRKNAPQNK